MTFHEWAAKWGIPAEAIADWCANVTPSSVVDDGHSESHVQAKTRLASVEFGSLWRNNAGVAETETRPVRYGLGNDSKKWWEDWRSSDLIGISRVTVQMHHVGRTFGVFSAIEMKHPGWNPNVLQRPSNTRERAQLTFLTNVAHLGGIAGFATGPDDYRRYVASYNGIA